MNNQTQEALKMAIEQLEADVMPPLNKAYVIAKLKEALEQPAQEPVVQITVDRQGDSKISGEFNLDVGTHNLYTRPHQWQGLTNDRIREIGDNCLENNNGLFNWIDFARAIEQALKEKNT
jgi:hypothetical protein